MQAVFDAAASAYDAWYETELGQTVDEVEKNLVFELLKPLPGQKILELGCGTGNYLIELAQRGLEVTGLDLSPAMLAQAKKKLKDRGLKARLLQADIHHWQPPREKFEAVLSVTTLEFLEAPAQVLAKAFESLKPGGRLVVGIIAKSPWSELYVEMAAQDPYSLYNHAVFYSEEELLGLLPLGERETRTGLYFPPDFANFEREKALSLEANPQKGVQPGFVCALWRKSNV